ncbi:MAG: universal stress protein [Gemmatimonadota bacterium]|jgi:nucleotide-binding universal stress UspA family protein
MADHIVVAVDDASAFKDKGCALNCAGTLARHIGGKVALLHVQPPESNDQATITPYQYEGVVDARRTEQKEHLSDTAAAMEQIEERVEESWGVDADARAEHGDLRRTLQQAVESLEGDLLIARTGEEQCPSAYLARLPDDVIRDATVPVLFVPGGPCRLMHGVGRALVPLDGSPGAEEALPYALHLLEDDGTLHLLTVVPPSTRVESLRRPGAAALRSPEAAEHYLDSVASRPDLQGVHVEWNVLTGMSAEEGIRSETGRVDAHLLAMSTRAHTGLSGILFGNVTGEVLRTSHVPILVHRTGSASKAA